jgi:hypothetical protein
MPQKKIAKPGVRHTGETRADQQTSAQIQFEKRHHFAGTTIAGLTSLCGACSHGAARAH